MGLDMFLHARRYLGDWDFSPREEKMQHRAVLTTLGLPEGVVCAESPSLEVSVTVAYWRKANQVHGWFIRNCADDTDDCRPVYVSREQLQELKALCEQLLESRDPEALPPQEGFFFGSYEIDDWYWSSLESTVEQLGRVLSDPALEDKWEFEYEASW